MSEGIVVAIILSLPGTAAVALTWWNGRKIKAAVNQVASKVEEVHQATNGMKAELVKVTGEKEFARGEQQGVKDEKARQEQSG